jgi:hypothetical protein
MCDAGPAQLYYRQNPTAEPIIGIIAVPPHNSIEPEE